MRKANAEIRAAAKNAGVHLWQVAECLGYTDGGFSKLLRHELTEDQRQRVVAAIEKAKENKGS